MWAEWRAATRGAIAPEMERRRLWQIDVAGLSVLDLRDPGVRGAVGVELEELVGPRSNAQALTERARSLGAEGMVVPSAASEGAWNLVVLPAGFDRLTVRRGRNMHPRPPTLR